MKILNRAKSFYSDEYFISQDIKFELEMMYLRVNGIWRECEESTRSMNFDDMLDSQGNKIFASLSASGKGGDIMKDDEYYGIAKYKDIRFVVEYENVEECLYEGNFEVIGIQE